METERQGRGPKTELVDSSLEQLWVWGEQQQQRLKGAASEAGS